MLLRLRARIGVCICRLARAVEYAFLVWRAQDLKYTYEEMANPEEFWVPYVWALTVEGSAELMWTARSVRLFPPEDAVCARARVCLCVRRRGNRVSQGLDVAADVAPAAAAAAAAVTTSAAVAPVIESPSASPAERAVHGAGHV